MDTQQRLVDKVALVTGSSSGIGAGIAQKFADHGARVVLHGRNREAAEQVIERIATNGVPRDRLAFVPADLVDVDECRSLVTRAVERFGGVDILVNNAGDFTRGRLDDTDVELWDRHMALNLRAPFVLTQAAAPWMRERGGGSIVNIGSVNAYIGAPDLLSYSVSKGGLMTFTKNVSRRLAADRIRINQINVGWTLTEGEQRVQQRETGRQDWLEAAVERAPFGRLLLPEDIAGAALYFASDDSAMVTGSVLVVEQRAVH